MQKKSQNLKNFNIFYEVKNRKIAIMLPSLSSGNFYLFRILFSGSSGHVLFDDIFVSIFSLWPSLNDENSASSGFFNFSFLVVSGETSPDSELGG